jgi:hypothetical protein
MQRTASSSRSLVRLVLGMLLAFGVVAVPVSTQVPGQNVNMISVDRYLQKQNEVDLTISPVNPCHIVGAANDYRSVNNRGLNSDGEIGDSWVGVYVSTDCGDTWLNYLMPGYGQGYTTAADPIARFGPGGGLYISHIQFNRGTNWGRVAVARYFDFNNFEGVPASTYNENSDKDWSDPFASPVGYLGTTEVARGSAGQFLDKPALAVVPGAGQACAVTGGRTIPPTDVLVSWTEFLSKSDLVLRTKVYFARYTNCGQTLAAPATKLSEGYPVSQGSVIAVNPANPNLVYVAWRQVATDKTVDAIIFVRSTDGGRTFSKPTPVTPFDGVSPANYGYSYKPFDQPTTSTTFRTLGYPTMVVDETGRAYLAVSARVGPITPGNLPTDGTTPGAAVNLPEARILMTSTADGAYWETPKLVDEGPAGHQFMPALAYAGGRLNLTWYDLRYDESKAFKAFADEKDAIPTGIRHTLDVRGAQAPRGWPTTFLVYGVSDIGDDKHKVSLYYAQNGTKPGIQLNFNPGNLKLYSGGTKPFMGDYIGTAGLQYLPNGPGQWTFNDATAALNNAVLRTFHTAWTDNRDAIVGAAGYPGEPTTNPNLDYAAPGTGSGCTIGTPEFAKANSRNANIYTSRITPGLFLSALGNTKPGNIERAFAIQVENGTEFEMTVRLSITSSVNASFVQPASSNVKEIDVAIGKFSSTARTIYVAGAATTPRVDVVAQQTDGGSGGLRATIVLNGDPISALVQPGNGSDSVAGKDTHNPRVENPRVENPRVENSSVKNPRVENPRVENPRVENPRVENATVETPRVENPRVENPRVENSGVQNAPYSDITYEVTNDGNTTSAFDLDLRTAAPTAGYEFQLIAWRGYRLPYAGPDCKLTYKEDPQVLVNEPLFPGELGYWGLPAYKRTSVVIRPDETISWTLRAFDVDNDGVFEPFCSNPESGPLPEQCTNKLTVRAAAQAGNADETGWIPPTVSTWPINPGPGGAWPASFVVSTVADSGPGSLRQAITDANAHIGSDLITFNIPGAGVHTIAPTTALPPISDSVAIDATSQPGFGGVPLIELSGLNAGAGAAGLSLQADGSVVRGLVINRFSRAGVYVTGSNCLIAGNYIGTDATGNLPLGNGQITQAEHTDGIVVDPPATGTLIGGSSPADRNIISGNPFRGIGIYSGANTIRGNYLGINAAGSAGVGTGDNRQELGASVYTNDNVLEYNVSSGHRYTGFSIGRGAKNNTVRGNYIGTNAAGTAAISNRIGVLVFAQNSEDTTDNRVGDPATGSPNVISGNQEAGVWLTARGNRVEGNLIGLGADGSTSIPNDRGVIVGSAAVPPVLGWGSNQVGGFEGGDGNRISGNTDDGVMVLDSAASDTRVIGNAISRNGGAGLTVPVGTYDTPVVFATGVQVVENTFSGNGRRAIVLNDSVADPSGQIVVIPGTGVPVNDDRDLDDGPNHLQNFPVITSVVPDTGTTAIAGTLNSTPGASFAVELFSSGSCDPSGHGPGATYLGSVEPVSTDAAGDATISSLVNTRLASGTVVTATARNTTTNDTSEFSECWVIGTGTLGSILGRIVDLSSLPIPGALVTLRNVGTGVTRTATSTANGNFRFSALPAGTYEVTSGLSVKTGIVVAGAPVNVGDVAPPPIQ